MEYNTEYINDKSPRIMGIELLKRYEEEILPDAMQDDQLHLWKSVDINYHPPRVERLWRQMGDYRLFLHRIHPCTTEQALFHPHPWPSVIKIVTGTYRMRIGDGIENTPNKIIATMELAAGTYYDMSHIDGWHDVAPIGDSSLSIMITGPPWDRDVPEFDTSKLEPLSTDDKTQLFTDFKQALNA